MSVRSLNPFIAKKVSGKTLAGFIDEKGKTFKVVMTIDSDSDIDVFLEKYNLAVVRMGKLPEGVSVLES